MSSEDKNKKCSYVKELNRAGSSTTVQDKMVWDLPDFEMIYPDPQRVT